VVYLSFQFFTIPIPELTYGRLLQTNNQKAIEITRDAKEKETRALWKKDADDIAAKLKAGGLSEAESDRLKAQQAIANRQATAPAASEDAKFGRYLTVPSGVGMWNFLALTFCLMVGTAGLPHILTRYYTTPSVRQARTSVAWSLFFIFLLYFTAPAYAAFARFVIYARLVGSQVAELPRWVTLWQPAGLFEVVDKNKDGLVQWADFVVKSTDFVVLAMPEIAGLPFVITGLVMAGGLAAALSTADGLLLTIANAISHDLYYNVIDPRASLAKRLTITKVLLVVTALIAAYVATFRVAIIVELVAWAFSLAGASFFPALVMGIWWRRANRAGACWGMAAGLAVTAYYMIGSRFFGVSWFGTQTIASAIFGLPVGFIVIWIVSLVTAPPPREVQDLVASVRYPKSGQATKGDPLGRDLREMPAH
jgi:cation/acetate symporter